MVTDMVILIEPIQMHIHTNLRLSLHPPTPNLATALTPTATLVPVLQCVCKYIIPVKDAQNVKSDA